ncbi:sodium/mannose cotransporter SLC5A10-like isoform X2 [Branchiostoma lanceolatum]|uniref:sodium/mannose cotransporter SLC5A10-like isoform X2 n=1 Tax=Branchiostoma lanceolatum TaxID=7740 RepID=UPI003452CB91
MSSTTMSAQAGNNSSGPPDVLARGTRVTAPDIAVVVLYLVVTVGIALWSMLKHHQSSAQSYFLAGRNMNWVLVGGSLFSSNIGSEHFIGLAGSGAATGIAVAGYEWNSIFIIALLGWLFVPVYLASGVYTAPEYLYRRFNSRRLRVYATVLSLLMYVLTKISVDVYAGALFIQQSLDWNLFLSVAVLIIITGFFTLTGGLRAVMVMDTMQTVLMVIGALVVAIRSFHVIGGIDGLFEKYPRAITTIGNQSVVQTCGKPPSDALHMIRGPETADFPWPGFGGIFIASIWYWCTDQVIVQRCLAAESLSHAKGGCVVTMFLKILPMFLIVMPGMISRILNPDTVGCADPIICQQVCESQSGCSNTAYPQLVLGLMPAGQRSHLLVRGHTSWSEVTLSGLRGLMLSVMVAALMSSLTSVFNSSSTIFTMDVWRNLRKDASQKELMVVGRITVLVMVAVSIAWIPFVKGAQGAQLFIYIQFISGRITPTMAAIFLLAILWTRTTEQGAFWGAMCGTAVGLIRLILDFVYPKPTCPTVDTRPDVIKLHFLYFNIILFVGVGIVTIVVSLFTEPLSEQSIARLTWWTRHSTVEYLQENPETPDTEAPSPPMELSALNETGPSKSSISQETSEIGPWYKRLWRAMLGLEESKRSTETQPGDKHVLHETRRDQIILNIAAATACVTVTILWIIYR